MIHLDYLRLLFKEKPYVELVYMTGILPIKKYGTHSALNMFDEISMIDSKDYSEFMGFTEAEVQALCEKYDVDYAKMKEWYDGYHMRGGISTYSPRSVTASINNHDFENYWSQTETYEALRAYIDLNYDGLKETSILNYNDENALAYTVSLAYITAKNYYTIVRELPAGKGFADLVFIPKPEKADKPAMIIELKYDKDADSGIRQIEENRKRADARVRAVRQKACLAALFLPIMT